MVGGGRCRRGGIGLPTQQDQTVLPTVIQINYVTEIGVPKNRLESLQRSSIFHNKMLHMARKRSARTFSLHSRGPPGRYTTQEAAALRNGLELGLGTRCRD